MDIQAAKERDAALEALEEAQGKLSAVEGMKGDFDALLRDVHKRQYGQAVLDYPPVEPTGNCHSHCRHVFLIWSALGRILHPKEGNE